jgi:hypothetical protein
MTLRYARDALIKLCVLGPVFVLFGGWFLLSPPHYEPAIVRLMDLIFHNGWAALGVFCIAFGGAACFGAVRLLRGDLIATRAAPAGLEFNTTFGDKSYRWAEIGPIGIEKRRIRGREYSYLAIEAAGERKRISLGLLDATPLGVREWIAEAERLSRSRPDTALAEAVAAHAETSASAVPERKSFGRKGVLQ